MNREIIKECIRIAKHKRYLLRFEPLLSDSEYTCLFDMYTNLINDFKHLFENETPN